MAIYEHMKAFFIWDGYGVPKYSTSMSKFSLHISNLPMYDLLELVLSWGGSYDISKSFMGRQLMRLFVTHALWRSRGKERTEKWKVIRRLKKDILIDLHTKEGFNLHQSDGQKGVVILKNQREMDLLFPRRQSSLWHFAWKLFLALMKSWREWRVPSLLWVDHSYSTTRTIRDPNDTTAACGNK